MSEATPAKPHDPGSSGFWWIPAGLLASAAAAIVLWWVWPPNEEVREIGNEVANSLATSANQQPKTTQAQRAPLPNYVLETDGGLARERADTGETSGGSGADDAEPDRHRYHRDTPFEWVLRPVSNPDAKAGPELGKAEVGVRGFAFVDGGSAGLPLTLEPLMQFVTSGAIRISGKVGQLGLEPGRYTIALVLGRPDALPVQAADVFAPPASEGATQVWAVRRVDVMIED